MLDGDAVSLRGADEVVGWVVVAAVVARRALDGLVLVCRLRRGDGGLLRSRSRVPDQCEPLLLVAPYDLLELVKPDVQSLELVPLQLSRSGQRRRSA